MSSQEHPADSNSLDDIFGSSPPHADHDNGMTGSSTETRADRTPEPSELPSLRRQHVTAGYRDGISTSKGEHVQRGFDAGFPIGAQLGMRAGTVLGILEGVLRGYESRAGSGVVKKQRAGGSSMQEETPAELERRRVTREAILTVYREAGKELKNVQAVFAGLEEHHHHHPPTGEEEEEEEKPETQLARKGEAVVSKWEERVRVGHWEENMDLLEMKSEGGAADADADPRVFPEQP
ncbi:hypothetical protein P175DRAFT_0477415 [Aspergillus ochraceoroseus IBT 24754]|uniref:Protein YAE1 n=1 Tax=Aspergillus ochraceoroseus IBT 24754 TaxID=1392256 RepID=A0A2T5LZW4_9EURO|nr:uncharacterized protein P175DRAFT_0477415 [Aspergillus ochraceoroseus IBT 24754]PTU21823.1 hypothetical protein P175DRAFT_0477415 [Aspergillus ochraceoroseus IBT 24754]